MKNLKSRGTQNQTLDQSSKNGIWLVLISACIFVAWLSGQLEGVGFPPPYEMYETESEAANLPSKKSLLKKTSSKTLAVESSLISDRENFEKLKRGEMLIGVSILDLLERLCEKGNKEACEMRAEYNSQALGALKCTKKFEKSRNKLCERWKILFESIPGVYDITDRPNDEHELCFFFYTSSEAARLGEEGLDTWMILDLTLEGFGRVDAFSSHQKMRKYHFSHEDGRAYFPSFESWEEAYIFLKNYMENVYK